MHLFHTHVCSHFFPVGATVYPISNIGSQGKLCKSVPFYIQIRDFLVETRASEGVVCLSEAR